MYTKDQLTDARILIIDDIEDNVLILQSTLEDAGYTHIWSLTDSRNAVTLHQRVQPDLILLDLMMPYVDGFQLLDMFASVIPEESYLPIVILTADTTREVRHRALVKGATDFLNKPLDSDEILLRIRNLLLTRLRYLAMEQRIVSSERLLDPIAGQTSQPEYVPPNAPADPIESDRLLTAAEVEAVRLAAHGLTYAEIAQQLQKSVRTIDNQLRSARAKLGARNQIELVQRSKHLW